MTAVTALGKTLAPALKPLNPNRFKRALRLLRKLEKQNGIDKLVKEMKVNRNLLALEPDEACKLKRVVHKLTKEKDLKNFVIPERNAYGTKYQKDKVCLQLEGGYMVEQAPHIHFNKGNCQNSLLFALPDRQRLLESDKIAKDVIAEKLLRCSDVSKKVKREMLFNKYA